MNFVVIGTNYRRAPVDVRERMSVPKNRIKNILFPLAEEGVINGAVILSTCNRTEFYASVKDISSGEKALKRLIYEYYEEDYSRYLYTYTGRDALMHIFSVACGLDSQVLGETQILGQIKEAYKGGRRDSLIDMVFTRAIRTGSIARRDTNISRGSTSVGSVAIDLVKKRAGGMLGGKKILIIGAGKVSLLAARYLQKEGADTVFVSNRTYSKALEFAKEINAAAVRFDRLNEYIPEADIIISTTGAPHTILGRDDFGLYKKPLLIVDLALPRDVSPCVGGLDGIELLCLDDLNEIIQDRINKKGKEALAVKEIIRNQISTISLMPKYPANTP